MKKHALLFFLAILFGSLPVFGQVIPQSDQYYEKHDDPRDMRKFTAKNFQYFKLGYNHPRNLYAETPSPSMTLTAPFVGTDGMGGQFGINASYGWIVGMGRKNMFDLIFDIDGALLFHNWKQLPGYEVASYSPYGHLLMGLGTGFSPKIHKKFVPEIYAIYQFFGFTRVPGIKLPSDFGDAVFNIYPYDMMEYVLFINGSVILGAGFRFGKSKFDVELFTKYVKADMRYEYYGEAETFNAAFPVQSFRFSYSRLIKF